MSNWFSWTGVVGQSDTSAVGFTQFAGCPMKLIVLPTAGHSFSHQCLEGKQAQIECVRTAVNVSSISKSTNVF